MILFSSNYFENGLPESCFNIDDPLSVLNGLSYGDLPIPGQPEMHHVGGTLRQSCTHRLVFIPSKTAHRFE